MNIQTIGIIGAGQMGIGIAHVFALSEFQIILNDISQDALDAALEKIKTNMNRQLKKGQITQSEIDRAISRIETSTDFGTFKNANLIIEAATENEDIKISIFKSLLPHINESAILTTNTSSISITKLAACTDRPEKFMGFHFMNPVPLMQLVELIRGIATSEETFEVVMSLVEKIGKTAAISEDFPGFIVNRILIPMINEAAYTVQESVGTVTSIDNAMKLGANHPMGPLELADLIGLDTCLAIMKTLYDGLGDTKYRPCPLLVKYVEAGWLGRKTKRGFYDYRGDEPVPSRPSSLHFQPTK